MKINDDTYFDISECVWHKNTRIFDNANPNWVHCLYSYDNEEEEDIVIGGIYRYLFYDFYVGSHATPEPNDVETLVFKAVRQLTDKLFLFCLVSDSSQLFVLNIWAVKRYCDHCNRIFCSKKVCDCVYNKGGLL